MKSRDEMRAHIIGKATEDETFRSKLLSDPKSSIEEELGITIPDGVTVQVHENTTQNVHLVLPPAMKLSDTDLKANVVGGSCTHGSNSDICY